MFVLISWILAGAVLLAVVFAVAVPLVMLLTSRTQGSASRGARPPRSRDDAALPFAPFPAPPDTFSASAVDAGVYDTVPERHVTPAAEPMHHHPSTPETHHHTPIEHQAPTAPPPMPDIPAPTAHHGGHGF